MFCVMYWPPQQQISIIGQIWSSMEEGRKIHLMLI